MTMTKMLALVFSVAFNDPVLSASKGQWRRVFASRDWPLDVSTEAALNAEAASAQLVAEHPRTLRAVVTPGNPRDLTFVVSEDSEVKITSGCSKEVWDYMLKVADLKLWNITVADNYGSNEDVNNTMTGLLHRGEADVSLLQMAHCCGRHKMMDLSQTTHSRHFSVIFRQPETTGDIFLTLFSVDTWTAVIVVMLLLTLSMLGVSYVEEKLLYRKTKTRRKLHVSPETQFGLFDVLSWCFCVLSCQGLDKCPRYSSGRVLFLTGFCFSVMVFSGFSANIVTTLGHTKALEDIQQLLSLRAIKMFSSVFGPFQQQLANSNEPQTKSLWQRILEDRENSPCYTRDPSGNLVPKDSGCDADVVDMISFGGRGDMAFVAPEEYIDGPDYFEFNHFKDKTCELSQFRVPMGPQTMHYGLRTSLPHRADINSAHLRLRETGLLGRIKVHCSPQRPECSSADKTTFNQVALSHIQGAYVVLVGGFCIALLLVVAEKVMDVVARL